MKESTRTGLRHLRGHLLLGLITAAPLAVTWLVFDFLFKQLSRLGAPAVAGLAHTVRPWSEPLAQWLREGWMTSLLSALLVLLLLVTLGWFAGRLLGRRVLQLLEAVVRRIPIAAAIYGGTKSFLSAVERKPGEVQRVVLIPFPSPQLRAVGFVTRVLDDADGAGKIAVVYVPTSPNPTSGYIELVPLELCTPMDWSIDEAMSFVMTSGATAPATIRFGPGHAKPEGRVD
ncbi:MAG: DUF502 domain-containing protein [Rubrivivax sp.]|nr:DUF502 domain-containing protein [Rubrivivax sp.]MDP3083645.1 DUF502 domain-containing protein [Rubrivivax sp.]